MEVEVNIPGSCTYEIEQIDLGNWSTGDECEGSESTENSGIRISVQTTDQKYRVAGVKAYVHGTLEHIEFDRDSMVPISGSEWTEEMDVSFDAGGFGSRHKGVGEIGNHFSPPSRGLVHRGIGPNCKFVAHKGGPFCQEDRVISESFECKLAKLEIDICDYHEHAENNRNFTQVYMKSFADDPDPETGDRPCPLTALSFVGGFMTKPNACGLYPLRAEDLAYLAEAYMVLLGPTLCGRFIPSHDGFYYHGQWTVPDSTSFLGLFYDDLELALAQRGIEPSEKAYYKLIEYSRATWNYAFDFYRMFDQVPMPLDRTFVYKLVTALRQIGVGNPTLQPQEGGKYIPTVTAYSVDGAPSYSGIGAEESTGIKKTERVDTYIYDSENPEKPPEIKTETKIIYTGGKGEGANWTYKDWYDCESGKAVLDEAVAASDNLLASLETPNIEGADDPIAKREDKPCGEAPIPRASVMLAIANDIGKIGGLSINSQAGSSLSSLEEVYADSLRVKDWRRSSREESRQYKQGEIRACMGADISAVAGEASYSLSQSHSCGLDDHSQPTSHTNDPTFSEDGRVHAGGERVIYAALPLSRYASFDQRPEGGVTDYRVPPFITSNPLFSFSNLKFTLVFKAQIQTNLSINTYELFQPEDKGSDSTPPKPYLRLIKQEITDTDERLVRGAAVITGRFCGYINSPSIDLSDGDAPENLLILGAVDDSIWNGGGRRAACSSWAMYECDFSPVDGFVEGWLDQFLGDSTRKMPDWNPTDLNTITRSISVSIDFDGVRDAAVDIQFTIPRSQ